ncbi:MAG: glucose-6-phosphate isomerase [Pseudomonadota bacterium]
MPGPTDSLWQALAAHQTRITSRSLMQLFAEDSDRTNRYRLEAAGLTLDYSKNYITDETLNLFSQLIDANALPHRVQQMILGDRINNTERRPALHTLLRTRPNKVPLQLSNEARLVAETLERMSGISGDIRRGKWQGATGRKISDIIHIGIGGSYLGPRMVAEALTPYLSGGIRAHYVANVDGHHIDHLLTQLDAESTLVIIASKTFGTLETMQNAASARDWLLEKIPSSDLAKHLIAISANVERAAAFGVSEENILPLWDWVGGRYSLWSAIGLPIAITHGFKTFRGLLDGAAAMDLHFEDAPWPDNMPMMLALLGIWYNNFFDAHSHAILPYDHWLRLLPAHLQQLDMESNGKSVNTGGMVVNYQTGPVIWGGEGTNGQHAFHQLLHQGTRFVSTDFILPLVPHHNRQTHHDWLVANCLAQSQALMQGRDTSQTEDLPRLRPQRAMPGNRPSNTILMDKLTPENLGALIALYEHKVFCQAMIWHINPFDQWGVELGKELGDAVYAAISGDSDSVALDPSTARLVQDYLARRK